ncbi:uncharacterized protein KY384_008056 [Bacidia gigantensis]|uniref:uncharacterized protein n=1 Tax=Bacidia gigantensis TaxID=2732470 RepID=UPI001D04D544|nr:uncharacterized protein KY384_008056 [Bacidia gigantensis]KAG8527312.1 hypothetical protein KY384_008056 [Bacidia gigantensis]
MPSFTTIRSLLGLFLTLSLGSSAADSASKKPKPLTLNFGSFSNRTSYVIAAELGYFNDVGLIVNQTGVAGSIVAYQNLLDGGLDVLEGTIDNILDRRFNQGQQFSAVAQTDQGDGLTLFGSPDITSIQQFRGKTLLVDSPTSGYVLLARRILSLYGLQYPDDYSFAAVGAQRVAQLLAGGAATIFPYQVLANLIAAAAPAPQKPNILARAQDFVNPLSDLVLTVASSTLTNPNGDKYLAIQRFVTALLRANAYLAKPANKRKVIQLLQRSGGYSPAAAAEAVYGYVTDPAVGEIATDQMGRFDVSRQGLLNVIDVRNQFGGFAGVAEGFDFVDAITPGPGKLIDYALRDRALKDV